MMKQRTTPPTTSDRWWSTTFNPCLPIEQGTVLPNCVGYAWGRYAEILGHAPVGLPTCNAGDWIDRLPSSFKHGMQPKLGAVGVWKRPDHPGHVAVVEEILSDGRIKLSESSYGNSWDNRWNLTIQGPPHYMYPGYTLQGFIYNPAAGDTSSTQHPALLYVTEALKHVGNGGHSWVMRKTSIGRNPWAAATCCAIALAVGLGGNVMPSSEYVVSKFGKQVVEQYGGQYLPGPAMGGNSKPQIGDFILFSKPGSLTTTLKSKYDAYHIGIVRDVKDDKVLTVEGNNANSYRLSQYRLNSTNIGWYARPNWAKLGYPMTVDNTNTQPNGSQLYQSESTREDAAVREVGYLNTSTGKPTSHLTSVKLSAINYTGLLSSLVGELRKFNQNNDGFESLSGVPLQIATYFKHRGLSYAAISGILGNIEKESSFNTAAVNESGHSGICQWGGDRKVKMMQVAGKDWATNLTGQLDFMWIELTTSYAHVLRKLKAVPDTEQGVREAADVVVREYEIPGNHDYESKIRGDSGVKWYKRMHPSTSNNTTSSQTTITTQSGKTLQTGTSTTIPSSVAQTGIIPNYTSYTYFYNRWADGTNQQRLSEVWASQGKPSSYYIATISGYYLIAVSPKFGQCGDIVTVVLEDDSYFNAIIADIKGGDAESAWGHVLGGGVDIVEWEANGSSQDDLRIGIRQAGWSGKEVKHIINYGTWFQ